MSVYQVVFYNLKNPEVKVVLDEYGTYQAAQEWRKTFRKALGGRNWTVDRRPGLDTMGNFALGIYDTKLERMIC